VTKKSKGVKAKVPIIRKPAPGKETHAKVPIIPPKSKSGKGGTKKKD
jgi:hypothetical protein